MVLLLQDVGGTFYKCLTLQGDMICNLKIIKLTTRNKHALGTNDICQNKPMCSVEGRRPGLGKAA